MVEEVHSVLSALGGPLGSFNQKVQRKMPEGG